MRKNILLCKITATPSSNKMATSGCHKILFLHCFYLILSVCSVYCWDTDDLELFDLVEEVNGNFYELLDVTQVKKIVFQNEVLL